MKYINKDAATFFPWQEKDRLWFEQHPGATHRLRRAQGEEFSYDANQRVVLALLNNKRAPGKMFRCFVVEYEPGTRARLPIAVDAEGAYWFVLSSGQHHSFGDPQCATDLDDLARKVRRENTLFPLPADKMKSTETGDACFVCGEAFKLEMTAAYSSPDTVLSVNAHVRCATARSIGKHSFGHVTLYMSAKTDPAELKRFLNENKTITLFNKTHKIGR